MSPSEAVRATGHHRAGGGALWQDLSCARPVALTPQEDVLFALCLVESRAIQTDGVCGALVPLLDHLRISVDDGTAFCFSSWLQVVEPCLFTFFFVGLDRTR